MGSETPRAVVFCGPGRVEIQPQDVHPAPGETVVHARVCAISHGTEMLFFRGPFPKGQEAETLGSTGGGDYPVKYGYMAAGTTGEGSRVFAFYPHQSVFALPQSELIPIPDELSDDDAVLFPSMETALQIVHDAGPRLGERVVVFGLGMVGTLVALLLDRMDVRVVAVDPLSPRRDRLAGLGVPTADPTTADPETISGLGFRGRPDIAINTSGSDAALQMAIEALAPEGTVVEASWFGSIPANLRLGGAFHRKRLTIRASQVSHLNPVMRPRWDRSRRTETVLGLLGEVRPSRFITHRFRLDEAQTAYQTIAGDPAEAFQVVLDV